MYTGNIMYARVGDRLVVRNSATGRTERHGVILKIRGESGRAPFIVRWDDGRESWYIPAAYESVELRPSRDRRPG
ncbi:MULTISPECIES: DUF1918 domain-containing protein [Frankia]|nr:MULTISPECIES: DUF1918 domain-containing protein [Frankia]